jgi:hypothetical protein
MRPEHLWARSVSTASSHCISLTRSDHRLPFFRTRERAAVRNLTRWIVLALFAILSVLGQGLHLFIGCGSDPCCATVEESQSCTHAGHACCGPAHAARHRVEQTTGAGSPTVSAPARHDSQTCLICRFLAQSQLRERPAEVPSTFAVRPLERRWEVTPFPLFRHEPYSARAPPRLFSRLHLPLTWSRTSLTRWHCRRRVVRLTR